MQTEEKQPASPEPAQDDGCSALSIALADLALASAHYYSSFVPEYKASSEGIVDDILGEVVGVPLTGHSGRRCLPLRVGRWFLERSSGECRFHDQSAQC